LEKRVKRIFDEIQNKPDAILLKNSTEPFIDNNFFYVTGLDKGLFEGSVAILFSDGKIDLLVPELESELAKKVKTNLKVYREKDEFDELLKDSISSTRTIGLNYNEIIHKDIIKLKEKFPKVEFIDVSEAFANSRLIKDEFEIGMIKKACEISDTAMKKIPDILQDNIFEYELAAEIDYLMQKNGADKSAFETISSFGANTAEPHYSHGDTRLKKGDFIICDFGACFHKYNSDITRTFVFGKASEEQKKMFETVFEAQKIGLEIIKPSMKAYEVHDAVNEFIENSQFKGRFVHSTGHSLGLSVHDGNAGLKPGCETVLKENMVFTVEPGVYIPGFGGVRIEDDVLIKKDGIEILTKSSRELIEI
jgi:Xaa-Pro dipeptidase